MMKARKQILTLLCLFLIASVNAQIKIRKESREKIKALKIAYITEQLNLTEKEAEKFWPIYNAHEEKMHQFRMVERGKVRKTIKEKGGISSLNEKESELMLSKMMVLENKVFKENQAFRKKLMKILPNKKILQLDYAERGFKREMFERLKRRKKQKR